MPLGYNSSIYLICRSGCPTSNQPLLIICSVLRTPQGSVCKDYHMQEYFPLLLSSIHFKLFFTNDLTHKFYSMFHWSITLFSPIWVKRNQLCYFQLTISTWLPSFRFFFSCSYIALILRMFLHWHQVCFSAGTCNLFLTIHWSTSQNIHLKVKLCLRRKVKMEKNTNHICSPHGLFLGSGTPEIT